VADLVDFVTWLAEGGIGPAIAALPVDWVAAEAADAARRWFRRLRRTDDLSRLVTAASGLANLNGAEFRAVRGLLENPQTWSLLGRGTVEDLAALIAECLPARHERAAGDSLTVGRIIARGLLEFAVAARDPEVFQKVLLARLGRLERNQEEALDAAMLGLHADLACRFTGVMKYLETVLDRLPPDPAHRLEIAVYLRTLVDWMNEDPWPRDVRFGAEVLTPASVECTRRLHLVGKPDESDLDADELAKQCERLVILGGSGSGKTWLAKRITRRCAEGALEVLAGGRSLDEVEVPLYTTCSGLPPLGDRADTRHAVVSSALDRLPDLGSSRLTSALREFFTERPRHAPTLLVIDGLDEAPGSYERIGLVGTLPWRIVLTSRQSSWNHQLDITRENDLHQVGELKPLRYPEDVSSVIEQWFNAQPEEGRRLAAQIERRPGLQQAATIPLILAFYCILGSREPLPQFRNQLYAKLVRQLLTGRWRGFASQQINPKACIETLEAWACFGTPCYPISGIGWPDVLLTESAALGEADREAVDHVATPLGPPDLYGKTLRRFVHRAIREHLVAEHVAGLPAAQAAEALLPHLWYDPDWEYAAPAALAMHLDRSDVLRKLIRCAAASQLAPEDLSLIDSCWEFRGFLSRIAAETSESDWEPDVLAIISGARLRLALSDYTDDSLSAASWPASNRQARTELLKLLATQTDAADTQFLISKVIQLSSTAQDQAQSCNALLNQMTATTNARVAGELAWGLAQLQPTAEQQRQAREALLAVMADHGELAYMADYVAILTSTPEDKRVACEALLRRLARETIGWQAVELAEGIIQLDPTAGERRRAVKKLLDLSADASNDRYLLTITVVRLVSMGEDTRQTLEALLELLVHQIDTLEVVTLTSGVVRLASAADGNRHQALEALLSILARQANSHTACEVADSIAALDPDAEERHQARKTLLKLLEGQTDPWRAQRLARATHRLIWTPEDKTHVRRALLKLLHNRTDSSVVLELGSWIPQLDPTADDHHQIREALRKSFGWLPVGAPPRQVLEALLELRLGPENEPAIDSLAPRTAVFDAAKDHHRQTREDLLTFLVSQTDGTVVVQVAQDISRLSPTAEDRRQVRAATLKALGRSASPQVANELIRQMAQLDPTSHDLSTWPSWAAPPTTELLAAARHNSALQDWLTTLPCLAALST
jgi:hypothetical protein